MGDRVQTTFFNTYLLMRRGSISVEAAIVVIAFIVVAASFAFMIMNSGLFTTQASGGAVEQQVQAARSALEVSGSILGYCNGTNSVTHIIIPIRLAADKPFILLKDQVKVSLTLSGGRAYGDIYNGTIHNLSSTSLINVLQQVDRYSKGNTSAYAVWLGNDDGDDVFDPGEKVILVITLSSSDYVSNGGRVKVELVPSRGVGLSVERVVVNPISGEFIDLG